MCVCVCARAQICLETDVNFCVLNSAILLIIHKHEGALMHLHRCMSSTVRITDQFDHVSRSPAWDHLNLGSASDHGSPVGCDGLGNQQEIRWLLEIAGGAGQPKVFSVTLSRLSSITSVGQVPALAG
jgi:hypothetical protein